MLSKQYLTFIVNKLSPNIWHFIQNKNVKKLKQIRQFSNIPLILKQCIRNVSQFSYFSPFIQL